jgi:hypothetical protein
MENRADKLCMKPCKFLRECVGNKMILGCGVPLLAAANGTTDYCRIGPDIHLNLGFWHY